jgi:hypothetical protein
LGGGYETFGRINDRTAAGKADEDLFRVINLGPVDGDL